jgi:alcohol dehydrogenase (cytochrome c)
LPLALTYDPANRVLYVPAGNPAPDFDVQMRTGDNLNSNSVIAIDAENGSVKWKFQTSRPILAGVTPTAGGVVSTADLGGQLYALDATSGRVLWQTSIGQSTGGGIITYIAGGRQMLGVASGMKSVLWPGAAAQSRVVVYGLR